MQYFVQMLCAQGFGNSFIDPFEAKPLTSELRFTEQMPKGAESIQWMMHTPGSVSSVPADRGNRTLARQVSVLECHPAGPDLFDVLGTHTPGPIPLAPFIALAGSAPCVGLQARVPRSWCPPCLRSRSDAAALRCAEQEGPAPRPC